MLSKGDALVEKEVRTLALVHHRRLVHLLDPRVVALVPRRARGRGTKTHVGLGVNIFANDFYKISNLGKFLAGSFSAVSKRNFARKYAFDSICQALQDVHTFAPLQIQHFSKKSV